VNEPPEIISSDPDEGEPLVIDLPQIKVFVVVLDPNDGEALDYRWTVSGLDEVGTAEPFGGNNYHGSRLTLDQNPLYDGRSLRVQITDTYGDTTARDWEISVPEAEP
jgi:hypothetical protein